MTEPIATAELDWTPEGLPRSRRYGDVYFSSEGGLAEARHVFLEGNRLPQRLARCRDVFTVGETGFGSGLNFLALWALWERVAPPAARLHFISAEKHPLQPADMARIHALFPEIAAKGAALRQAMPLPVPGAHRLHLAGGRVQLTLLYGDAAQMFAGQHMQADAWFLDGFAPRLNPGLWSAQLAAQLRRLSAAGATVATFSTSTTTCDALAAAGFTLDRQPGFGRKKYMLTGWLGGERAARPAPPCHARVIGGGLAGAATAHALALRGVEVEVIEAAPQVAAGASGNPSAIFYPAATVGWQPLSRFYFAGFSHTLALLRQLSATQPIAHALCGMLLFPKPSEDAARQPKLLATMQPDASLFSAVDAAQASQYAGIALPQGGLWFPQSGWVNLADFTRALLAHPRIATHTGRQGVADAALPTVLCGGWSMTGLHPALHGAMHGVAGQVSCLPPAPPIAGLRCVLSYGGYLTPAIGGVHHLGASYDKNAPHAAISSEGHATNLGKLAHFMGEYPWPAPSGGWAAMRSVSRDRMPLAGELEEGLYANTAHASRGLLSCALGAELVASQLCHDPLPLDADLAAMLNPLRFMEK